MIELLVKNINDKYTLKTWLELASKLMDDTTEINQVINRLNREIAYDKNFSSDEYEAYKRAKDDSSEEPIFPREDLERTVDTYIQKRKEDRIHASELLNADHSKAVDWMVKTGKFLDDEAIAYGNDEDYGNLKPEIKSLQNMFIEYVHNLAEEIDKHELYNDPVDEWYFQLKDTDRLFEKNEYFFPTEAFVFDYEGHTWYYSETHGQGTSFGLCVLDKDGIIKLMKDYGLSQEDFDKKVYHI